MPKYTYFAGNFIEEDILNACYSPNNDNNNPPIQELFTALRKGSLILKHGRSGRPKTHFFRLISSDTALSWRSSTGSIRQVNLKYVTHIVAGQSSSNCFKRWPLSDDSLSFSLHYGTINNDTTSRTLDLTCSDQQQYNLWFNGLNLVCSLLSKTKTSNNPPIITTTTAAAAAAAAAVTEYIPGDLLLWGSSIKCKPNITNTTTANHHHHHHHHCNWERNATPSIAPFNSRLDVVCAAVGRRHALVATSCGSVYVWGEGGSGRCGLGHDRDQATPQLIKALSSSSSSSADHQDRHHYDHQNHNHVVEVACSDEVSAAVTSKGELYMWGRIPPLSRPPQLVPTKVGFNNSNNGGQTSSSSSSSGGGGGVFQMPMNHHHHRTINNSSTHNPPPARNSGLLYHQDVKIKHISCASFHCAAVDQDGGLWTWGEGFGGKLGHGDQESRAEPQLVEAFHHGGGKYHVTTVSCGVWHTAAIAVRTTTTTTTTNNNNKRGILFTWGGVNESIAFGASSSASSTTVEKRDSNRGCLGLGDSTLYTGSLLPRPVVHGSSRSNSNNNINNNSDIWQQESITSVAAGSHLTVVVTASGRVYQMGSTGATVNAKVAAVCPWEGSTVPEQVKGVLTNGSGWFIEHVSCGMHHVVASGYKLPVEKKVSGTDTGLMMMSSPLKNTSTSTTGTGTLTTRKTSTSPLLPPLPPTPPQSPKYMVFTWGRGSEGQLGRNSSLEDCITPTAILGDSGSTISSGLGLGISGNGGGGSGGGGGSSNTSAWSSKGRVIHGVAAGGANSLAIIDHDTTKYDMECSKDEVDTITRQLASKLKRETKGLSSSAPSFSNNNNSSSSSSRKKGAIATTIAIPQYDNGNYSGGPPSSSSLSTDGGGGIGGYLFRVSHSSSSIISVHNMRASGSFTTLTNITINNSNNNNIQQPRMSLNLNNNPPLLNEAQPHHPLHHPHPPHHLFHHYQVDTPTPNSNKTTSIFSAQEGGGRKSYAASSSSMSHKTDGVGGGVTPPSQQQQQQQQQPSSPSVSSSCSSPAKAPTAGAGAGLSLYTNSQGGGGGGGDGGTSPSPSPQYIDEGRAASLPLPLPSSSSSLGHIGGLSSRPRRYHVQQQPNNYHHYNNTISNNDPRRSRRGPQQKGVGQGTRYKDDNNNEDDKGPETSAEKGRNRDEEQQLIALKQAQLQNQQERLEKWAADLQKKEVELREKQVALESQFSGMHLGSGDNSVNITPPPPPPPPPPAGNVKEEGGKLSEVEVQPGVILVLSTSSEEDGSMIKVKRIRFSGSQFTKDSAAYWYEKNQGLIMEVVARQNKKQKQGVVVSGGGGGERGQGVGDVIGTGGVAHKNNFSFDAKELASFYENVHGHG
jgi:alpha-tubulin suppressor-like RCC1 family protein